MRIVMIVEVSNVSCLRVVRGRVRSRVALARSDESVIASDIRAVLGGVAKSRAMRRGPRVDVVLGRGYAQVRRIEGLPNLDLNELTAIARDNPFAFYLRTAARLVVSDVVRAPDDQLWAAAYDDAMIEQIAGGLKHAGFRIGRISPLLMPEAAPSVFQAGPANGFRGPLSLRYDRPSAATRRFRRIAAGVAMLATSAAAYVAPGAHAWLIMKRTANPTNEHVSTTASTRLPGASQSVALLDELDRLEARRSRAAKFLATLSQSLPSSASIRSIRIDSSEASISIIAPHIGDVLDSINARHLLADARLVGGLTRTSTPDSARSLATIRGRLSVK